MDSCLYFTEIISDLCRYLIFFVILHYESLDYPDVKRVDHMYQYKELTNNEKDDTIY